MTSKQSERIRATHDQSEWLINVPVGRNGIEGTRYIGKIVHTEAGVTYIPNGHYHPLDEKILRDIIDLMRQIEHKYEYIPIIREG